MTWLSIATKIVPEIAPHKKYSATNKGEGIVWHSHEGIGIQSLINIMKGPRQTSFMFWLPRNGGIVQFAPTTSSVWCSGNRHANTHYWPVEMEGFAGEPINDNQMASALQLIGVWEDMSGKTAERGVNMLEHREVATRWTPNAGPTTCPSGRYERLWEELEVPDMTPDEVRAMILQEVPPLVEGILKERDLVPEGDEAFPTLKRLSEAEVARWGTMFEEVAAAIKKASNPNEVPDGP